jgi:hypothetical protein
LAIGVKGAFGVEAALHVDPLTEPIAIDCVAVWDAGVPMDFDIVLESAETLLPHVGPGVPCPAVQPLEAVFAIGVKGWRVLRVD